MFNQGYTKVVLTKIDPRAEGSFQYVTPRSQKTYYSWDQEAEHDENVLPDCPERAFVVYHLLRMVRDLYINSKDGGQSGAYRKQCRTKRKSALMGILNKSEEPLTFRWSCKALGFDPDTFRNRVLFDVHSISDLVRDGVRICEVREKTTARKTITEADVWMWDDTPARYQLSEKKGHYVVKMNQHDADSWIESLKDSPLEFSIERFDLTSGSTILILRHK